MGVEENRVLGQRVVSEIWSKGNLAVADEILAANFVQHRPPPDIPPTRDGYKQWATAFRTAFPDLASLGNDIIAEGDKVVVRWTVSGTHNGDFMGTPASGNRMTATGISVFRVVGGKIGEDWTEFDAMGMMRQIGAMPSQSPGS